MLSESRDTNKVAGAKRLSTRWIIALLVIALGAAAITVYALLRMTSPASLADESPPAEATDSARPTITNPLMSTATSSATTVSATSRTSPSTPPPPPIPLLDVPLAWSGSADITVTVIGDCAAAGPMEYRNVPADIAIDGQPSNSEETQDWELSIGINPGGLPSLAIYSAIIDDDDQEHAYWDLSFEPTEAGFELVGEVVSDSADGPNPNFMVDAETALQPCEPAGTLALPRILATGSTLSGFVTNDSATVTVTATTTDGKRETIVEISANRATS